MHDFIILGAGLSGLSAAHVLQSRCIVTEAAQIPGGLAQTNAENGYHFDLTGHLLHLRRSDICEWIEKLMEAKNRKLVRVTRNSCIFSYGVYTEYPYQQNTYGLPPTVAQECVMEFVKAFYEKQNTPERDDLNFEEFCLRHFGKGFTKHFMVPYNKKLWGVHPQEVSTAWCSRFVPKPTLDEVIGGAVGVVSKGVGYNASFLTAETGMHEIIEAMADPLSNVVYGQKAVSINTGRREVKYEGGKVLTYKSLISTVPLNTLCDLIEDLPVSVREASKKLQCTSLLYLDVALKVPAGVPYHWVYVPEESVPFYRIGCYSNICPNMAPVGCSCLYIEMCSRDDPRSAEDMLSDCMPTLLDMGWIKSAADVAFVRKRRINHAYVIYNHEYTQARETVLDHLRSELIFPCGRYATWVYCSMEDCMVMGQEAAAKAELAVSKSEGI